MMTAERDTELFAHVPEELKRLPQWVLWRYEERDGKTTKVPCQANGLHASTTDPATWTTFQTVVDGLNRADVDGVGVVVTDGDPFFGVDLDHCVNAETGEIEPWAAQIVQALETYTEITPSGEGLRCFAVGTLPTQGRKRGNFEVYSSVRFLTVTGRHLEGTPLAVNERTEEIAAIHARIFSKPDARPTPKPAVVDSSLGDDDLLGKAMSAKNGADFSRLYRGEWQGRYPSQSEADLALAGLLLFWTGGDIAQADRLFRSSALIRPKWDERHGGATYGEMTMAKALEGKTEFYTGHLNGHSAAPVPEALDATPELEWDPPLPFTEETRPSLPVDAFPEPVLSFVKAEAVALQVPVDLIGLLALGVGAASAAGRAMVQIKGNWTEQLNQYLVGVLPSGERKSAAYRDMVQVLLDREKELVAAAEPQIAEEKAAKEVLKQRLDDAKRRAATAKGNDREIASQEMLALAREFESKVVPARPRLWADDATPEATVSLLADNGGRIAILSPEGGLFEIMSGRYSEGVPNLDIYLKAFTGDACRVDRKGRGPEYIERPALTLVLTVQPTVIGDLAAKPGFRGRGLLARFLYCIPVSMVGYRDVDAPEVPEHLRAIWNETVRAILRLPSPPPDQQRILTLSVAAQALFRDFQMDVERALLPDGEFEGLEDWGNKYAGSVARISGILHLFEHARTSPDPLAVPISETTLRAAIQVGEYFKKHAKSAFSMMGADETVNDAKYLLAWLQRQVQRAGATTLTKQEIWQSTKGRRFQKVAPLEAAIHALIERNYLREVPRPYAGVGQRPAPSYAIYPHLESLQPLELGSKGLSRDSRDSRNTLTGEEVIFS